MRFEEDAFAQLEFYIVAKNIYFKNINLFVKLLKTYFDEVNLVSTAKYKLYRLYQTNKDLKMFLNTFLQLLKKAKIDNFQVLDMLYKKLCNEFKNRLVTVRKAKNFKDLILLLSNRDAHIKKISKQS